MKTKKLTKHAIDIAYRDEGQGMPVVLLHGFCGSSAYFDEIVPLLRGKARLIVPDLPGHGQSGTPTAPYPIESFADDISELIESLGIPKAIWFGHSLGGYVTLAAAERHAAGITAYGLIHSTAYPDDDKGKETRLKSIQTIRDTGIQPFVDGLIPKLFAPEHVQTMVDKIETAKKIGYTTTTEGAIRTLEAMRGRPDRNAVLEAVNCPILLVAGESDQIIKPDKTFSVNKDNITQVLIQGSGHMSMMEHPQRLTDALLAFLSDINL
ncbi:alpha/beta fold hydrolase [Paenibacillus hodogayensis]|uniref:Alpha/beta fold hydrolase n=1 Tax=Paenibacillus hodogayensis TaxID=279208 RepID=A0ABV5W7K6_9BACL